MNKNDINNFISDLIFQEIGTFYQGIYEKITKVVTIFDEVYIFSAKNPFINLENISNNKIYLKLKGLNGEYLFNDFVNFKRGKYLNNDIKGYYVIYSQPKNAFFVVDSFAVVKDFVNAFKFEPTFNFFNSVNKLSVSIINTINIKELIKKIEDKKNKKSLKNLKKSIDKSI